MKTTYIVTVDKTLVDSRKSIDHDLSTTISFGTGSLDFRRNLLVVTNGHEYSCHEPVEIYSDKVPRTHPVPRPINFISTVSPTICRRDRFSKSILSNLQDPSNIYRLVRRGYATKILQQLISEASLTSVTKKLQAENDILRGQISEECQCNSDKTCPYLQEMEN